MSATPPLRVADVFRAYWADYLATHRVPAFQQKAVGHILQCRTPALGGHVWRCASCGHRDVLYNSSETGTARPARARRGSDG